MMRHDVEEWKKVEDKEMGMLKSMGVYVDEDLPEGRKAIGNRWVFEFKLDVDGGPPIDKARLVAQGFSQVPFVNYDATFAPVAKSVSVRFVAVHAALHGWHVRYISSCVTLTVTVFITQVSHPSFLLRTSGYGPRPLDCAFAAEILTFCSSKSTC